MKVPEAIEMDWGITYQKYMSKASLIQISGTDDSLKPIAELCFKHLKMLVDCEKKEPKLKKDRRTPLSFGDLPGKNKTFAQKKTVGSCAQEKIVNNIFLHKCRRIAENFITMCVSRAAI